VLEKAGARSAAALVSVSTHDATNLAACRMARQEFGIPHLIARCSDSDIAAQLLDEGVRVVQPQLATVLALEGALHFPSAFDMLSNHADGVEVREVELTNPRFDRRPLRQIRLPGDALILGLRRSGEILVPHGDTNLELGDLIMLVGHQDSLHKAMVRLNRNLL
jgi:Trk K+ transport system NAD-binding subunit